MIIKNTYVYMRIRKQEDIRDCGLLVIQAIHNHYYSTWIKLNELKININFGEKGINIKNLITLAEKYGIEMEAYEVQMDVIASSMKNKYIVGLVEESGMNHYVIFKYKNNFITIWDSLKGQYKMSLYEFKKIYKGISLTISKKEYIPNKLDIVNPLSYLSKNLNIIIWTSLSIVISIILTFIASIFMKIILDKIIPGRLNKTLTIVCLSFGFLAILRSLNELFKSFLVKKLSIQIEKDLTYNFFNKLGSSHYEDISKITINDNLRRIGLISHVSGFISNSYFVIFNELTMLIISISLLMWISPTLFAITLGSGGIICLSTVVFRIFIRDRYDSLITNQMNVFNTLVDSINYIKELKSINCYKYMNKRFEHDFFSAKNKEFEIWSISSLQILIEKIIMYIVPILIVYLGTKYTFSNKLSIGSLIMFLAIFNNFIYPVKDLADFMLQLPQQRKNINLISFVINLPDEGLNKKGLKIKHLKSLYIKELKVGYDKPLLKIDSLKITGDIKLVGSNGSGKTTFLKALSTVISSEGSIFYNSYEKDYYDLSDVRKKIITISPDSYIPKGTILEYITLGNKESSKFFVENLDKYNLVGLLKSLELSLDMMLNNNAMNISSGQRQVVTLLRLFAFKYELVILDEAFENIDFNKLEGLRKAIKDCHKGIIIEVSHSRKYITEGKEVNIEKINSYIS